MVQSNENKEKKLKILRWVLEIQFDQIFWYIIKGQFVWWVPEALEFRNSKAFQF